MIPRLGTGWHLGASSPAANSTRAAGPFGHRGFLKPTLVLQPSDIRELCAWSNDEVEGCVLQARMEIWQLKVVFRKNSRVQDPVSLQALHPKATS